MSGFFDKLKTTFESLSEGSAYVAVKQLIEDIKEAELEVTYLKGMVEELKKDKSEIGKELYEKKLKELEAGIARRESLKSELKKIKELIKYV